MLANAILVGGILLFWSPSTCDAQSGTTEKSVPVEAYDTGVIVVPAGSAATLFSVIVTPTTIGRDVISVGLTNSQIQVSLITPSGTEITAANDSSVGYEVAGYSVPTTSQRRCRA